MSDSKTKAQEMHELAVQNSPKPPTQPQIKSAYKAALQLINDMASLGKFSCQVKLGGIRRNAPEINLLLRKLNDAYNDLIAMLKNDGFQVRIIDELVDDEFIYTIEIAW